MGDVLIGIDLGTTVLKAAAFDAASGRLAACASQRLRIEAGPDGKREQDPAQLDAGLRFVMRRLRKELGRRWSAVAGLGLAAQGGSAVIVDRRTGRAHSPLVLWNDMRFHGHTPKAVAEQPASFWRELSWSAGPGWGLSKINWLRSRNRSLIRDGRLYSGAGDYLFFRLTGRWRQDAGNALQEGCFNVPQRRLDGRPLELAGVSIDFVSPLRAGHEQSPLSESAARDLGLPAGLPVAGPYMDHEAGYMSAAGLSERPLQFSLGTAWVGNFVLPRDARWSSPFQLVVPSPVDDGWQVVQPLLTGNVTWDWALQTLLGDPRRAIERLEPLFAESLLPPSGLACLPWLNMPSVLWPPALGAGAFYGVSAATSREDLLRALAAGMCYETARVFEDVVRSGQVDSAILSGGASKGTHFQKLLAVLLSPLPVKVLVEEDWSGARGALYALRRSVARATARPVRRPPARLEQAIRKGLDRYRELFERLHGQSDVGGPVGIQGQARSQT